LKYHYDVNAYNLKLFGIIELTLYQQLCWLKYNLLEPGKNVEK